MANVVVMAYSGGEGRVHIGHCGFSMRGGAIWGGSWEALPGCDPAIVWCADRTLGYDRA